MPYGMRIPEAVLRSMARQRLDDGQLPLVIATTVSAGYGSRKRCALCDSPVEPQHVEYEVGIMVFHVNCHSVWQLECAARLAVKADREESSGEITKPGPLLAETPDRGTASQQLAADPSIL
jgi:hypothetical protein